MTTEIQKRLVELLVEFDKLCSGWDLSYSLCDRLAWDAVKFGKFHDRTYDAFVTMPVNDLEKFTELFNASHDASRELELYGIGVDAQPRGFRYVAADSLLLDLDECESHECFGIAIEVVPICIAEDSGKATLPRPDGKGTMEFDVAMLCEYREITFEKNKFNIFTNFALYFSKLVGAAWRDVSYPHRIRRDRFGVISDPQYPYGEYLESARKAGLFSHDIVQKRLSFQTWFADSLVPVRDKTRAHYWILRRTSERFRLWEKYYSHKTRLVELESVGEYELVDEALGEYTDLLKVFYARGMTICFDERLFELALGSLERQGFSSIEEMKGLVPESHRIDLAQVVSDSQKGVA